MSLEELGKGPFSFTYIKVSAGKDPTKTIGRLVRYGWQPWQPPFPVPELPASAEVLKNTIGSCPAVAIVYSQDDKLVLAVGVSTPGWVTEKIRRPIIREIRLQLCGLPRLIGRLYCALVDDQGQVGAMPAGLGVVLAKLLRALPKPAPDK